MNVRIPRPSSVLEETFALQVRVVGLPEPMREFVFDPARKWRADFAFPRAKLLIELEGGVHSGGRHTRAAGFIADAEKYNAAAMLGYHVLRYTMRAIRDGSAIAQVEAFLAARAQRADLFSAIAETLDTNTAIVSSNDGAPAVAPFTPA